MKVGTLIIMTGAILALTASAASANLDRILPVKQSFAVHHKVLTHKKVVAHKVAKKKSTAPRYIHFPGTGATPAPADDCASTMNNCTDQQLCDIWGMNCDLITTTPAPVAAPTEPAPEASSTTTAASTDFAPADNSTLCPSGSLWDYEYQYCN